MSFLSSSRQLLQLWVTAAAVLACEPAADVAGPRTADGSAAMATSQHPNAAIRFNVRARELVASRGSSTPFAMRGYAILSIAQYHAALAAADAPGPKSGVPAAVGAASVEVLSYLFPNDAPMLQSELAQYIEEVRRPGHNGEVDAALEIGRAIAAQVVDRAKGDRFNAPWTGTVPTGPGMWYSSANPPAPPAGAAFGDALPFLLHSTSQFRPAPHPAFGSPEFAAALAEVRAFSDTRTPAQDSIAKFWHLPPGTYAPPGYWNDEATTLAARYSLDERRAARVLALTNITMYDALLASHEAKYHYWLLRPSQADAGITLSVGLPNFPSYPSNHAAISAGAAIVLGDAFPQERGRLLQRAQEAALSRVFGGIHYRFDGEAGIELGTRVAAWTLQQVPAGHRPLTLRQ